MASHESKKDEFIAWLLDVIVKDSRIDSQRFRLEAFSELTEVNFNSNLTLQKLTELEPNYGHIIYELLQRSNFFLVLYEIIYIY